MLRTKSQPSFLLRDRNTALLLPTLLLGLIIITGGLTLAVVADDSTNPFKDFYLMPWIILTGITILAPSIYLFYKKQFNFFHPLVFAAWSYFFPAFFIGGLILSSGLSQPYFLAFVEDERYNLPLTLLYVSIGFAGLSLGFFLPAGRKIGEYISRLLPNWDWTPEENLFSGVFLFGLGLANIIIAFVYGILGYQKVEAFGAYDGLLFMFTLFWLEASFLLWLAVFRAKRLNVNHFVVIGLFFVTALTKAAFQGNRGSLLQIFILIAAAFILSNRKVSLVSGFYAGVFLTFAIIVGMIYGTTFRTVKQDQTRVGIDEYSGFVFDTFDKVGDQDIAENLAGGFSALAERIEAVSSLAVVVSNYEKLKPYEENLGFDNNIWKESVTFFIPRFIWNDKPVAVDPAKFADLYFNLGENSFAITPIGDLLRNFGPIGVPLGMIFLGIIFRMIYAGLMENQPFSYWRSTLFFMLTTTVSYEGLYGSVIPYLFKVGFITVAGLIIIRLLQGSSGKIGFNYGRV